MTPFLQPFSQLNGYPFSTPDHQEPKQPNAQPAPTASPLSATTSSHNHTPPAAKASLQAAPEGQDAIQFLRLRANSAGKIVRRPPPATDKTPPKKGEQFSLRCPNAGVRTDASCPSGAVWRRPFRTKKALHQKDEMLSWFHFSSRPFPVSSKHLTHVTRPRLHTALTHGNPVSRISRSRFTRAASGRTSKTSWFGCSHPLTAVLWKPVLIFYSFRSLPFPVLYSLCNFS